ncbi:putative Prophage integrase IntR [Georgfuchsia toluolica]|uniref:Prophage integrase IntR n=1 Tax=Georgfuchsia toluolica TaxID=424218 RepID=A0A916JA10_9PROT|nr:tyrosine-type recombinase/integrase [Georgfuchsia toluolica]CAG4885098.1 putative Prophage integrase IntR [Georgfuchsia toluolica]
MDRRKGLTVRSGSGIEIAFSYRGRRCRETLKLEPTKANLQYAARKREAVLFAIGQGTFNYAEHFPNSPLARSLSNRSMQTVGQALDEFLKAARGRCAHSTVKSYESAVRYYLKPVFGEKLVCELGVADIKAWIGGLAISGKRINNVLIPLRGVLDDAFMDGVIERNPSARIKNLPHRYDEPDPLSPSEIQTLLNVCSSQVRNLFQFAVWTGLRTSELIGLEWGDIDWNRKVIRVRRAVVLKQTKIPKTEAGERDVKLLPGALEALEAQKPFSALANGRVFLNPNTGKSWETDAQIRRTAWQPAIRKAGIRSRNPYQTRHTFASLCLTAGEDIAWVAKQMGHKSIAMTLKRYARYMDNVNTTGGNKLTQLLTQPCHSEAVSG